MTNKLDEVLKKSNAAYEEEKKKFLDALGNFIEREFDLISREVCYEFFIEYHIRGADKNNRTIYGYVFLVEKPLIKNKKDYFYDDVRITLSLDTILKALESEYNAKIGLCRDCLIRTITIPFVWYNKSLKGWNNEKTSYEYQPMKCIKKDKSEFTYKGVA